MGVPSPILFFYGWDDIWGGTPLFVRVSELIHGEWAPDGTEVLHADDVLFSSL